MTVISWTAKSKAQIWDLFPHGEYFQPHRALIKHWIQKWIITKEENCKGWNFHFFTHYLTWLLLPPFGTKPLRAEQNNSSRVLFWMMEALDWCHLLPSGGHGDDERPRQAAYCCWTSRPVFLPASTPPVKKQWQRWSLVKLDRPVFDKNQKPLEYTSSWTSMNI